MSEVVLTALVTGCFALLVALVSRPQGLHKKLDAIDARTARELEHNHGSSMKDDLHGLAVSVGELQRDRDEYGARLDAMVGLAAVHHPEAAAMYLALRRNHR